MTTAKISIKISYSDIQTIFSISPKLRSTQRAKIVQWSSKFYSLSRFNFSIQLRLVRFGIRFHQNCPKQSPLDISYTQLCISCTIILSNSIRNSCLYLIYAKFVTVANNIFFFIVLDLIVRWNVLFLCFPTGKDYKIFSRKSFYCCLFRLYDTASYTA